MVLFYLLAENLALQQGTVVEEWSVTGVVCQRLLLQSPPAAVFLGRIRAYCPAFNDAECPPCESEMFVAPSYLAGRKGRLCLRCLLPWFLRLFRALFVRLQDKGAGGRMALFGIAIELRRMEETGFMDYWGVMVPNGRDADRAVLQYNLLRQQLSHIGAVIRRSSEHLPFLSAEDVGWIPPVGSPANSGLRSWLWVEGVMDGFSCCYDPGFDLVSAARSG
ncbi:hypothetical protein FB451DRAFT_1561962 [Mycena latifolia]|nr:hypothetical protein FB451DRAFT_1561962 [Mycena latifolia]